jgi:hypothetical protein
VIYTTARTHARLIAKDPNGVVVDADVLSIFQDVYDTYWETFLRDRLWLLSSFVQFDVNEYVKEANTAVRDVQAIVRHLLIPLSGGGTGAQVVGSPQGAFERDDFEAVCADAEHIGLVTDAPLRWGVRTKKDNSKPIIVIHPPASGLAVYDAWVYALPNTLSVTSPGGDLQGEDKDGYAVARLAALQIMAANGEDPQDIEQEFKLLDQKVQDKYREIGWRAAPRPGPDPEQ